LGGVVVYDLETLLLEPVSQAGVANVVDLQARAWGARSPADR
jgi:hypothetical protein